MFSVFASWDRGPNLGQLFFSGERSARGRSFLGQRRLVRVMREARQSRARRSRGKDGGWGGWAKKWALVWISFALYPSKGCLILATPVQRVNIGALLGTLFGIGGT